MVAVARVVLQGGVSYPHAQPSSLPLGTGRLPRGVSIWIVTRS